jgi:hypothetical protein
MVIVPAFLLSLHRKFGLTTEQVVEARSGRGRIVEAHPRAFLYSIIERIYRNIHTNSNAVVWEHELRNVVRYKDKKNVSHVVERKNVYTFIKHHSSAWLWDGFTLADADDCLFQTDHAFDAFLAAMTAFAFASKQVVCFSDAGISNDTVSIEGHISILRQPSLT